MFLLPSVIACLLLDCMIIIVHNSIVTQLLPMDYNKGNCLKCVLYSENLPHCGNNEDLKTFLIMVVTKADFCSDVSKLVSHCIYILILQAKQLLIPCLQFALFELLSDFKLKLT